MKDNQNLAIGVLTITAVVLLVGVCVVTMLPVPEARAIGQNDRGGDYIVVTGQFSDSNEVIYVTDGAANRINVYSYDWNRGIIALWDSHDLTRTFGKREPK